MGALLMGTIFTGSSKEALTETFYDFFLEGSSKET